MYPAAACLARPYSASSNGAMRAIGANMVGCHGPRTHTTTTGYSCSILVGIDSS